MTRWERFYRNIQQDLKLFLFFGVLFCLYRVLFIVLLKNYLAEGTVLGDVVIALFAGLRLSLKSTGIITLLSFLLVTIPAAVGRKAAWEKVRFGEGCVFVVGLTFLFHARIPYYETFHMAFNQMIFNALKDDTVALLDTLIKEYGLVWRCLSVILVSALLCWLLKKLLATGTLPLPRIKSGWVKIISRTGLVLVIALFMLFIRFGGSFTYARGINWENSALTRDSFLNEAILDDMQALYRAYNIYHNLQTAAGLNISPAQIRIYGERLAGRPVNSNNLEDYFRKEAAGARIPKPRHIFLVIGESYAEWPLLPKYSDLNIANGLKSIIAGEEAVWVRNFLPAGNGTIIGVSGVITGLAEMGLYPNYHPESYNQPYATAIAGQMKKLGYKTAFWYGGYGSWQRIKDFVLAQGFDEFFACGGLQRDNGNAWGNEDKNFLNYIEANFDDRQPTFNVILTGSNHPPYTVNLAQEGFDPQMIGGLPANLQNNSEWLTRLGHFWYADKVLTDFIHTMRDCYPESLYVVTGDHADRMNVETTPSLYERYAIPLVLYGPGVNSSLIPPSAAGSQIDITPTLLELIAPQGFVYYSVGKSLTLGGGEAGINNALWITGHFIGKIGGPEVEPLPGTENGLEKPDPAAIKDYIDAVRALSWWRICRGKNIE